MEKAVLGDFPVRGSARKISRGALDRCVAANAKAFRENKRAIVKRQATVPAFGVPFTKNIQAPASRYVSCLACVKE
jgi:hypothetical protein